MESIQRNRRKKSLGELEARLLQAIEDLGGPGIRLEDARRLAPWPTANVQAALRRLESKGRLVRLSRGRYYLAAEDPTRAACHAWAPSYVSFLTPLADAGFTEQIPRRLDLAYARSGLRTRNWGDLPITWHPIPPDAFLGYRARDDGALVATPAKAAADLVHRQRDFGGLSPYRVMIDQAFRRGPGAEVEEALDAYQGYSGTLRRLLFLRFGDRGLPNRWKPRRSSDLHNPLPLDPAKRGRSVRRGGPLNVSEVQE